jgi:hypothetical protein
MTATVVWDEGGRLGPILVARWKPGDQVFMFGNVHVGTHFQRPHHGLSRNCAMPSQIESSARAVWAHSPHKYWARCQQALVAISPHFNVAIIAGQRRLSRILHHTMPE